VSKVAISTYKVFRFHLANYPNLLILALDFINITVIQIGSLRKTGAKI